MTNTISIIGLQTNIQDLQQILGSTAEPESTSLPEVGQRRQLCGLPRASVIQFYGEWRALINLVNWLYVGQLSCSSSCIKGKRI